jgi:Holliday junction resolvase RusA-like endonuclease
MNGPLAEFFIPFWAARRGKRKAAFLTNADPHIPRTLIQQSDRYEVHLDFYHTAESNGDIDNRCTCVLDALKGKVLYDDWNVKKLVATIHERSDKIGVVVRVLKLPRPEERQ